MFWKLNNRFRQHKKIKTNNQNLQKIKNQSKIEREAVKRFQNDLKNIDLNQEQLIEKQRTTLTDEELAKTVQVDIEGVDDIEEFITKNLTPKNYKK